MDGIIDLGAVLIILLAFGVFIGLCDLKGFSPVWLIIAAGMVALNDALLTRFYGLLPNLFNTLNWNWEGKLLALAATLLIATLPAFGWKESGLTLAQAPGSLKSAVPVLVIYCAFFLALALTSSGGKTDAEAIGFQLTLPGFEEEPFYRGVLLLALDRAFTRRVRWLGVDWGWGAVVSSCLFGMAHALDYDHGHFSFDAATMAMTALPALIGVWLRLRTGSVLFAVIMHNFGNAISLLV